MIDYYPIGSVLLISTTDRRVMVLGRMMRDKAGTLHDYIGCFFPQGVITGDDLVYFDRKDILLPFSLGYQSEDELRLRQEIKRIEEAQPI